MNPSSLPSLPLDLPQYVMPPSQGGTGRSRGAPRAASAPTATPAEVRIVVVDAIHLTIDELFGMDVGALTDRYAALVADAQIRLSTGAGQSAFPHVMQLDDGRYAALTELPTALAAIKLADDPTSTNISLSVVLIDKVDGEALLSSVFGKQQTKSLWEKARYIVGCETKYRSRREWLRTEGISPATWEPRFSKIVKISKIDETILKLIDPHTISNAEVAGRIVDAWADPEKRPIIEEMTQTAAVTAGGIASAGTLFKRIDAALSATKPDFVLGEWVEGARDLRRADGAFVATLKRDSAGWSIAGSDLTSLTRSALASALDALKS